MRKQKILIITNHSYMLYQFRRELIARLQEQHDVVLAMPFVGHEEDFMAMGLQCINIDMERRGMNPLTELKLLLCYKKILKQEKPDLVITYSIKPNIYAGWLCGWKKIPFCANVQGLGTAFERKKLAPIATLLYKIAFRKVRTVFFENEANAAEFRNRGILTREKETVLKGAGINLEHYTFTPVPEHEQVHFLYLGRIMKEKGIDELFSSARKLKEENENFVLDLVGFFEDEYKEQVEQLEKDGIAIFHGFQSDPRPFYQNADAVVLPSYHEGMSNVLLEAAATGRAIITSDIPGCREAVDEGVNGFLCKSKDAESLHQAMKQYLELTPEARALLGHAGRRKMEQEFDKTAVVEATVRALGL